MLHELTVISMLVFIIAIFLIFKRPSVKVPYTSKSIHIDYGLASILCASVILASSPSSALTLLKEGVLGCDYVKPYSVIVFILSFSYICLSLDCTGFFEYVSLRVVKTAGASGLRLFTYLFLLTSFLSMFTSNDVVILTVTYLVIHICAYAEVDPVPYLIAQFFAANTLSMGLYIGNPTNIVIADAFGVNFAEFARWMLIPSISATLVCLLLLLLTFRRRVVKSVKVPDIDPRYSLKDRNGAIFGLLTLGCMLFLISLPTEWINAQAWAIALLFALVMGLYDLIFNRSRAKMVFRRMPWRIAPFLIGLFIIVEGLATSGWTHLFASQISRIVSKNPMVTISSLSFLSALAAGLMNNHPMTIFFIKTLKEGGIQRVSEEVRISLTSALVIGSNLGANYMLTGSLAGLIWSKILSDREVKISFSEFSKYGFTIMPLVTLAASLSLTAMFRV
ncbi:MAG: ArsB/NhaD family transporter [Candidatus Bathyarchaeia archaeon]